MTIPLEMKAPLPDCPICGEPVVMERDSLINHEMWEVHCNPRCPAPLCREKSAEETVESYSKWYAWFTQYLSKKESAQLYTDTPLFAECPICKNAVSIREFKTKGFRMYKAYCCDECPAPTFIGKVEGIVIERYMDWNAWMHKYLIHEMERVMGIHRADIWRVWEEKCNV